MQTVTAAAEFLEAFAPTHLAADWDNVGLLLGERGAAVERVVTCLTVTPEVVAEAVAEQAQLIVTHHPILFRAVKRLTDATPEGRMLLALIRHGVAVYSPHTAFDNTKDGINDLLAVKLGLTDVTPLKAATRRPGSARSSCSCRTPISAVCLMPCSRRGRVASASTASAVIVWREPAHSSVSDASNPTVAYEGPARRRSGRTAPGSRLPRKRKSRPWLGRCGRPIPMRNRRLTWFRCGPRRQKTRRRPARFSCRSRPGARRGGKAALRAPSSSGPVQLIGDARVWCSVVALPAGVGGEMMTEALKAACRCASDREMRFHDYLTAQASQGLALLLPGHYATERFAVEELARRSARTLAGFTLWASQRESNPVTWV